MTTDELKIWKRLNECECVKKVFGNLNSVSDTVYCVERGCLQYYGYCDICPTLCSGDVIWIPPLFDPIRPERSLWGLCVKIMEKNRPTWTDKPECSEDRLRAWSCKMVGWIVGQSDRPDLALAKAIIEQEETRETP